jgi:membrane protease YdiL (CAAX protease family)
VEDSPAALPLPPTPESAPSAALPPLRVAAAAQVILVSGAPTQFIVLAALYWGAGMRPFDDGGGISFSYFVVSSLLDTALVGLLITLFLSQSGESAVDVLVGARSVKGELLRGFALVPFAFVLAVGAVLVIRTVAPWAHNVPVNPLEQLMATPAQAAIFAIIAVLAGGVREELQRAFVLHRFEQSLGGIRLGLVLFTLLFAALHWNQGGDAAISIGLLGLFWGILYISRRSALCAMANHAGFNAAQVLQAVLVRSLSA